MNREPFQFAVRYSRCNGKRRPLQPLERKTAAVTAAGTENGRHYSRWNGHSACALARGMGILPMRHGLGARATSGKRAFGKRGAGFTLIELLAVTGIIGLLVALVTGGVARQLEAGRRVACASNLRQMGIAAHNFAAAQRGRLPEAYLMKNPPGQRVAWDYTTVKTGGGFEAQPGLLWGGAGVGLSQIQQCPSFRGAANWLADPYTGYNYNTSFVGVPGAPAALASIARASQCALFGDGQWEGGANKFMRSPLPSLSAEDRRLYGRWAGTQGYRHGGKTNVAFADGHVETREEAHGGHHVAPDTGFLSADNRLYALE
ncbi:MAG: prepilin-type N-terminal cleavage/methylation domain-containing protein [Candidatus Marinimicrobia bacterium]|nr:prepilin-type N-terminal cleavage/methylation domain-containing protein [Candidatus Neomarinimicrobiota bacterium]